MRAFAAQLRRELRGDRHHRWTVLLCLAVGVAAVVGVSGFTEGIGRGIRSEARQLLAADLAIRGRSPIPEAIRTAIEEQPGVHTAEIRETLTLVAVDEAARRASPTTAASLLVELKSAEAGYPFYGDLVTAPAMPFTQLLDPEGTVVAPEVLSRLGLEVGAPLKIGSAEFVIRGTVLEEPDRIAGAFSMGPRVFVSPEGLERAELVRVGSRVVHRLLVALPEAAAPERADELAKELRPLLPEDERLRIETWRQAQPGLRRGLDRVSRYLGLAALLSLLLGGIGVAQTMRAWIAGRLDAVAILRCLGVRPREVVALYLARAALIGLGASLLGIALGLGFQIGIAQLLQDILPVETLRFWQPYAFLRGLTLGTGIALLFSLGPVLLSGRVPPIRVLRRDADPLPPSRAHQLGGFLILAGGLAAAATWQSASLRDGALFTLGIGLLALLLAGISRSLARRAARPPAGLPFRMRYALVTLSRPGASPLGATVGLGLGVLAIVGLLIVERHLSATLDQELPEGAPTAFLIDIQPDQWATVEAVLTAEKASEIRSVPVVTARLAAVGGVPVQELLESLPPPEERDRREASAETNAPQGRWALRREQRMTWLEELPEDNQILEGALWEADGVDEVSLEEEYARELGAALGDVLTFDVQGLPIDLTVTSIRAVDWSSFGINFYIVVEPGVLEGAPHHRIAAARLPEGGEQRVQDRLVSEVPNVSLVRIREVLERVISILGKLGQGVRLLGLLTALVGLVVLAAAVAADQVRRGSEIALLKALGMTRRQIVAVLATEHALVGLAAGIPGILAASVLGWVVVTRGFELEWSWPIPLLVGSLALTVVLAVLAGLAAGRPALERRPIEVLRED